ncbi:DegT/DnrJ/EryC1/StrS family aminotransferase [Aquimarina agarilytica]|uniref:DegT/DnrJ/EryC1/StrS family aminotransferase n=1 Tax=Aquimarina agarilytica TaxID=1087449 RepID=UPI00028A02B1|nr:DegT/DnrJ/EryC1/StrS family aminotransferase [Aquimarina agarilytica]
MRIPFLNLHKLNKRFENNFKSQFDTFLTSGHYILGTKLTEFENAFASYCNVSFCIGTGNGLDALTLILKAYIELGKLNIGDQVIVPANTFIATLLSVKQAGLIPVLIEPDEDSFIINVRNVQQKITPKIKAIITTHLYGQVYGMDELKEFCSNAQLLLIADAAQAHGAIDQNGNKAGSIAHAAAFSFYPSKNLGALGDGGAITTNNTELANCIKKLRNYGTSEKYRNELIGINSRLDELQAAFLIEKLNLLDDDNNKRREIALRYSNEITNENIKLPFWNGSKNHVFYVYVIRVKNRINFCNYLNENQIGHMIHYPIPPHKQKALTNEFKNQSFPITEKISNEIVSIPLNPILEVSEIDYIIQVLNNYTCQE